MNDSSPDKDTTALVLECYARGYSTRQAAERAGVNTQTVERIVGEAIAAQNRPA
ncbi:helix-turn-helix domain-containing protein [Vannielia litorea]|uniref:helix-turn-helix domain-containing protein n=1 Tax=Vannielia litorea TaxID=1217970 RepID=UPI001C956059|nr:helix-turn-helix domain-containing protein [Vannielia litorea]MBY6152637.1 helix-turn-helix domain-containing protein [Vannielia litorea]